MHSREIYKINELHTQAIIIRRWMEGEKKNHIYPLDPFYMTNHLSTIIQPP